jgi:hypothetical protein
MTDPAAIWWPGGRLVPLPMYSVVLLQLKLAGSGAEANRKILSYAWRPGHPGADRAWRLLRAAPCWPCCWCLLLLAATSLPVASACEFRTSLIHSSYRPPSPVGQPRERGSTTNQPWANGPPELAERFHCDSCTHTSCGTNIHAVEWSRILTTGQRVSPIARRHRMMMGLSHLYGSEHARMHLQL